MKRLALMVGVLAFFLIVVGCTNDRVTTENYDRIHKGMPMEEVEAILGDPSRHHKDDYYYEGKYGVIKIEVERGRVDEKHWKDKK